MWCVCVVLCGGMCVDIADMVSVCVWRLSICCMRVVCVCDACIGVCVRDACVGVCVCVMRVCVYV